MNRIFLPLVFSLLFSPQLFGQNDQIINGDFENWSTQTITETLDGWINPILDNNNSPQQTKSSDAFDQNFSVRVETAEFEGDTVVGSVILGILDPFTEDIVGIPYNSSVDSLIAWVKYDIQPGDTAYMITAQWSNGNQVISFRQFTDQQTDWTRVAMAMNAPQQDSLAIAFSSSDIIEEVGVPGSWMMVDKVEFVHASTTPAPLPNNSFENWTTIDYIDPDGWASFNELLITFGFEANVEQTSDSHSGSSAAVLETIDIFGDIIPGFMNYGVLNEDGDASGIPYTGTPTSFKGWYKFEPSGIDTALISVVFFKEGTPVAANNLFILDPTSEYTEFNLPVTFIQFPDTVQILMIAGGNNGSKLFVDDFSFEGVSTSTNEAAVFQELQYAPNPTQDWVNFDLPQSKNSFQLRLFTPEGRLLEEQQTRGGWAEQLQFSLKNYPAGIYFMEIQNETHRTMRKIIRQ